MANVRQKHPSQLLFQRPSRIKGLQVVVPAERVAPPFPLKGIPRTRRRAREAWDALWRSRVSAAIDPDADREALLNWLTDIDILETTLAKLRREPVIQGRGALVRNPLWAIYAETRERISKFEERFGLTPQSRFRLNVTYNEAEKGNAERAKERQPEQVEAGEEVLDLGALGT
jgi:P27 family predicted phage terminase small subunit